MTLFTVTRHGSTFEAKTDNAVTLQRLIVTALSHRQGVEIWNEMDRDSIRWRSV